MDRCPNCDASVRPNAKFCTSCGFRLPDPAPEPVVRPDTWRSPFSTTSNYEHNNTWTPPVKPTAAPDATADSHVIAMPAPQPQPAAEPPAASASAASAPADFVDWPNFSDTTIEAGAPVVPSSDPASDPLPVESVSSEPSVQQVAAAQNAQHVEEPAARSHVAHEDPIGEENLTAEPDQSPTPSSRPNATNERASVDDPTEPVLAMTSQGPSGDVQHALGLVDELRAVIARLHGEHSTAPIGASQGENAAAILDNVGAGRDDSDALRQLRGAIAIATSRPRDIDIMLDLVSRAGAIQDLLGERDRFAAAITHARAALTSSE